MSLMSCHSSFEIRFLIYRYPIIGVQIFADYFASNYFWMVGKKKFVFSFTIILYINTDNSLMDYWRIFSYFKFNCRIFFFPQFVVIFFCKKNRFPTLQQYICLNYPRDYCWRYCMVILVVIALHFYFHFKLMYIRYMEKDFYDDTLIGFFFIILK